MPSEIWIRTALIGDVPAIKDVYRRASMSNEGDRPLFDLHPELLDWNEAMLTEGWTRLAVAGEQVVGFATLVFSERAAVVDDLFVHPDWQRRGIGRVLVDDMSVAAGREGWRAIEVDANPHAHTFYSSVGFVPLGEVAVEYGTGLRMRRSTLA